MVPARLRPILRMPSGVSGLRLRGADDRFLSSALLAKRQATKSDGLPHWASLVALVLLAAAPLLAQNAEISGFISDPSDLAACRQTRARSEFRLPPGQHLQAHCPHDEPHGRRSHVMERIAGHQRQGVAPGRVQYRHIFRADDLRGDHLVAI